MPDPEPDVPPVIMIDNVAHVSILLNTHEPEIGINNVAYVVVHLSDADIHQILQLMDEVERRSDVDWYSRLDNSPTWCSSNETKLKAAMKDPAYPGASGLDLGILELSDDWVQWHEHYKHTDIKLSSSVVRRVVLEKLREVIHGQPQVWSPEERETLSLDFQLELLSQAT